MRSSQAIGMAEPRSRLEAAHNRLVIILAITIVTMLSLLPGTPAQVDCSGQCAAVARTYGAIAYVYDGPAKSSQRTLSLVGTPVQARDGAGGHPPQPMERIPDSAVAVFAAEDGARLASRTDELTGALDPIAQNSRTSAVMSTRQGADVLASGGRDLSPAQPALGQGDDVLGRLPGAHAEMTAMDAAGKAGLTQWQMAVSRPICPACQSGIEGSGGTVAPGGMFAWWPW